MKMMNMMLSLSVEEVGSGFQSGKVVKMVFSLSVLEVSSGCQSVMKGGEDDVQSVS